MAAELNRQDIISDDALEAPLILAKNLEKAYMVIEKIAKSSKDIGPVGGGGGGAESVKKQREETEKLTAQQQELMKVQKQIATVQARNNELYIKEAETLKAVKQQLKEKTTLEERDAKAISAQNASINVLTAALAKNRAEYAKLANEEQRASKEGKELHAIIQQQDKEVKALNGSLGKHQDNVGNYEGALKTLKGELSAARDQMAGIATTLGTTSPEFIEAAQKAGDLKDQLNDVQDSVSDLSGGSGFERAAAQSQRFMDQFKVGDLKGATATLKGLATTIKGMTFKESIAGAGGLTKAMGGLAKAILTNPLFLLAAVLIGIGMAVFALKDKIPFLTKAFDAVGSAIDYVVQKGKEFSDWALGSSFIADEKAEKIINAAQKEIDAIRERYDDEIAIADAAGKDVAALERKKQEAIIAEATKGLVAYSKLSNPTEEQKKQYAELLKVVKDANRDIQIEQNNAIREREEAENKAWEERKKRLKEEAAAIKLGLADQRKQAAEDFGKLNDEIGKGVKGRFEKLLQGMAAAGVKIIDYGQTVRQKWENALTDMQKAVDKWGNAVGNLFDSLTARRIQNINEDSEASKEATEKAIENEDKVLKQRLATEQLTDEQREQIENASAERKEALQKAEEIRQQQYEARRRNAIRKQAIYEKSLALTQAIIAGALAVVKALPLIPLAIAAGAFAAVQIAAIAARPIPAAEKGITGHKGGAIIAGEKGVELVKMPGGRVALTDAVAKVYDLPRGTDIIPHDETMKILAGQSLQRISDRRPGGEGFGRIEKKLDRINSTIRNKREFHLEGTVTGYTDGGTRAKYIESLRNRRQ